MKIALSLGGNLGNPKESFWEAVSKLKESGLSNINTSSIYTTKPIGCAPGTPDFLNAVITGSWTGTPSSLFNQCKLIEVSLGRPSDHPRWSSRTIDLDIIFYGQEIMTTPDLTIPHKEAYNRLFVLIPLAEIAGDWLFPGKQVTVSQVLKQFEKDKEYSEIYQHKAPFFSE